MLLGLPLNIPKSLPYSFSFFIHINLFFLKKFCPSWVEFSKQLSDNLPKSCKLTSNQFVGSLIYNQNLLVNTKSSEIIIEFVKILKMSTKNKCNNFYLYLQSLEMFVLIVKGSLHTAHEMLFLIYHYIIKCPFQNREYSINTEKMICLQL